MGKQMNSDVGTFYKINYLDFFFFLYGKKKRLGDRFRLKENNNNNNKLNATHDP